MKKTVAFLLMLTVMLSSVITASALPIITGEEDGFTKEIYDGVYYTNAALKSGSTYGLQKLNIVEFDLANQGLDLEILKGDYIVSKKTVSSFVSAYNQENSDSKVIAAVNGDLWMTGVHSNANVTTSILTVPRGVLISDGVIYCSSQVPNEAKFTTNGEGHSTFWAFGMTNDYVPMIGQPIVNLKVSNTTQSLSTNTEAFNRLPAIDTLVVYNGDCNYTNFALEDAYEVVLKDIQGAFKSGAKVTGKVEAIYSASDSTSPKLTKDSVVLTARGTAIELINKYAVGDMVEIDISLTDASGRDNDWNNAKLAIGGHIPLVLDGTSTNPGSNDRYPSTIVGYKNDGKVIFLQNDGRQSTWSQGLVFSQADELMKQLGVNTCINLDGGGSSTMVVGDELVNKPSDGKSRAVINGIALVTAKNRAPQAEFEVKQPSIYDSRYVSFDTENDVAIMAAGYTNDVAVTAGDGYVRLNTTKDSIDPYIFYGIGGAYNAISASHYKYIVMKYKTSDKVTTPVTELFLCAGTVTGPTGGKSVVFNQGEAGKWHTQIVDLSTVSYWSGKIYGFRIDTFAGNSAAGEYMDVEYIAFAKTAEEAQSYADGTATIPTPPKVSTEIKVQGTSTYKINGEYLTGVKHNSTAYTVISGVSGYSLEIVDADGNIVRNQNVGTGYKVICRDMSLVKGSELTIAVAGDVNCDAKLNSLDAAQVLRFDADLISLDGLQSLAADINGDGKVNSLDAAYILKIDAGLIK